MSKKAIVLYLHAHQPFRLRNYTIFDVSSSHNYFETDGNNEYDNLKVLDKVSSKSYLPANELLLDLLNSNEDFRLNLSLSGTLLEQLERWKPDVLASFQALVATGKVEIASETFHHSLSFFYDLAEFERQVQMHREIIERLFGQTPRTFRNTELAYNNELGQWAERAGYQAVLAEGWDPILGWRSPNFVYRPPNTQNISLLLKNYRLSDDIAFRFGESSWTEWPLTADKFAHWLDETNPAQIFNLFMDYETFGEHQWEDKGIFEFLEHLPKKWLSGSDRTFMTFSQVIENFEPVDEIDMPEIVTWADTERDLTAWVGNPMQHEAIKSIYDLGTASIGSGDWQLIEDWRKLQTSDHYYYMCTKWFADGDVHAYFSPYESPYDGFINFMNCYHDLKWRLSKKGLL